jgi:type II secretory pathway component GspD/PulD (secretin)
MLPTTGSVSPVPAIGDGIFANMITGAGTTHQFAAAIDALQEKTTIKTLSTPKILAIHSKPAKVVVGGQQGYAVTTVNQGISTETIQFIDTGTILDITPYVDIHNNVLLKVQPELTSATIEQGIPVTNSTKVTTWMMAKNGETVFIAGLIQDTKTETWSGVPCLGDIPGIRLIFGRSGNLIDKSELVVLITPQVLEDRPPQFREAIEKTKEAEKDLRPTGEYQPQ